jgi:hypothetical protein
MTTFFLKAFIIHVRFSEQEIVWHTIQMHVENIYLRFIYRSYQSLSLYSVQ